MVSTSSLKNLQKTEKCPFQTLRILIFKLKAASKPFYKKLPITKFWTLCLNSPQNGFNFANQKLQKTEDLPFQTLGTFVFELTVASKSFSKKLPMTKFWLRKFLIFFLTFLRKRFQLRHSKICKKLKNALFKRSEYSFLSSRWFQNHFLRRFL